MKMSMGMVAIATLAGWASAAKWVKNGTNWELSVATYKATVSPEKAGKVVGFKFGNVDAINPGTDQGAFFWPAPQSKWNWPPPTAFNDNAYTPTFSGDSSELILTGPVDVGTKLQVRKRFSFDADAGQFSIVYTTFNTAADTARHFAPWEISRAPSGSLLFYPKGSTFKFVNPTGSGLAADLPLDKEDSLGWYQDVAGKYTHNKFFRDGKEGWLAQFKGGLLFVKQFPDIAQDKFAPGESEIEIYTSGTFVENEVLGEWTAIAPKDSLVWNVRWACATVPASANIQVGSSDLKAAARALVKPSGSSIVRKMPATTQAMRRMVDARGRLLPKSARGTGAGSVQVLPIAH